MENALAAHVTNIVEQEANTSLLEETAPKLKKRWVIEDLEYAENTDTLMLKKPEVPCSVWRACAQVRMLQPCGARALRRVLLDPAEKPKEWEGLQVLFPGITLRGPDSPVVPYLDCRGDELHVGLVSLRESTDWPVALYA